MSHHENRDCRRYPELLSLCGAVDLAKGIFHIHPVPAAALYSKAIELADHHSATLGTRSLDLMHVAAASILKVELFLSFDERQTKVAEAEGLSSGP